MSASIKLTRSSNAEFYRLNYLSENPIRKILVNCLKLPFRAFQYLIGRPLTHLILNPLFRKMEKNKTVLKQNIKYPDPMLNAHQDIVILNVIPETSFIRRILTNWLYQIKEFFILSPLISLLLSKIYKKSNLINSDHLDSIIQQVDKLMTPPAGEDKWKPEQIHFKGLEHLPTATRTEFFNTLTKRYKYNFEQNNQQYNFFTLKTNIGGQLDSLEIKGPSVIKQPIENRTFIVHCLPRSNNYHDWIRQHRFFAEELNTTLVAFNYRGIGQSKGLVINQNDMIDDATAQVHRLIALGVKPENIALIGECLGANIATKSAANLHKNGSPIKLFNARSFRSLPSILLARIRPPKNTSPLHPFTLIQKITALVIKYIIVPLTYIIGWDLSVDQAFKSIPPNDRGFLAVRSKKDKVTHQRYVDDTMIPHQQASIYSLVKEEQNRCMEKQKNGEFLSEMEEMLLNDNIKSHQFFVSPVLRDDAATTDGHTCPLRYLAPTHPNNTIAAPDAREYTLGFFKSVGLQTESQTEILCP